MKKKVSFLLTLIIFLSTVLRLYKISEVPPSLYWDEASIGYNAYSILETGRDEWGKKYPLLFRAFGEYKLPFYIYVTAISEKLFGLNEFAIRLPSVIAGILTTIVIFFLAREVLFFTGISSGHFRVPLLTALLMATSPWHLHFSRGGFEANLALFFVVLGSLIFLQSIRRNIWYLGFSITSFILSAHTYNSAKLFTPLFLIILFVVFRRELLKKIKEILLILFFLSWFSISLVPLYFYPESRVRFWSESFLNMEGKPLDNLANNFIANFSTDYLFFKGDQNGRHSVKKIGQLYLWQFPLVVYGIYCILKGKQQGKIFLFSWLFLAALPPAITYLSPHALRGILMLPVWQIFSAVGFTFLFRTCRTSKLKMIKRIGYLVLTLIVIYFAILYLHLYYIHHPKTSAIEWQDGQLETVEYLKSVEKDYDYIFLHKEDLNYIYLMIGLPYPPALLQESGHDLQNLGKYRYTDLFKDPIKEKKDEKDLIVTPYWVELTSLRLKKEIKMINGDLLFKIYEY